LDNFKNDENIESAEQELESTSDRFSVNEALLEDFDDADNTESTDKKNISEALTKEVFEWLEVVVTAVISVVVIFTLFFRVATIDGPSMKETLHHGDKVIVTNFAYKAKKGDIVVISRNKENDKNFVSENQMPIIKRVIAVEGQRVDIDFETGEVYVDDKLLDEPYISTPTKRKFDVEFPLTVAPGCVFVMGDNRMDSLDSRDSSIGNDGMVDTRYILGNAIYKIFPFNDFGKLN